jgi:dephospho-CoA kinase
MIKVCITGEMGSGKSYCSKIFEQMGIPVFYTDDISKSIFNTNQKLKKEICKEFGNLYNEDGIIIPKLLRDIVFVTGAELKLKRLNEIVHPYVFKEYEDFCQLHSDKTYTLAETALLFEANMRMMVDKVIYVCVDLDLRIRRTLERSGFSPEEYKIRMKSQINPETKKKLSDFIIYNNDSDDVNKQILEIHNTFYLYQKISILDKDI